MWTTVRMQTGAVDLENLIKIVTVAFETGI